MKQRGRRPNPLHGRGEVRADSIYPVSVLCRRLGICRNSLQSMRRRGLPVHSLGRRCSYVFGCELLDFLRANPDPGSSNPTGEGQNHGESGPPVPSSGTQGGLADVD
jgi:hypothetical protein